MIGWFKAIFSIFQGVSTIWNAFGSHIGLWLPTSIVATKTDFNKLIQLVCLGLTFAIIIGIYALIVNRLIGSSTQIAMGALNGNMVQMVFALTIALVTIVKNLIILIAVSLFLCPMALYVLKWILAICLYQTGLEEYVPLFLSESPKQCSGHWFWKSCKNKKRM